MILNQNKKPKKVMAPVFWDAKGILFVDYFQIGKTINSEWDLIVGASVLMFRAIILNNSVF